MTEPRIAAVLTRIRGEFLARPGLRLTVEQAQRLWALDRTECEALLGVLVDLDFLVRTRDGAFVRARVPAMPADR